MAEPADPIPTKLLRDFAHSVFTPIKNGQCVTTLWTAGSGKRFRINYLLSEQTILREIFGERFDATIFIPIHPDEIIESTNTDYLTLILEKLKQEMERKSLHIVSSKTTNPLKSIQEYLSYLLSIGKEVVFILNDFEFLFTLSPSIFLNLESLMMVNKQKVCILTLSHFNLLDEKLLSQMGNFKYAVLRNVVYVPLYKDSDIDYLIDFHAQTNKLTISTSTKNLLKKTFGGHPLLLKYSMSKLATGETQKLTTPYELTVATKEIWRALNDEEQTIVSHVVNTGRLPDIDKSKLNFLLGTGILTVDKDGKAATFGTFLHDIVKQEKPHQELSYHPESDAVFYGTTSCADQFSPQEYEVLKRLVKNKEELVSRDQVAESLWGKDWEDQYSDWAIDKVMSTIRKKLETLGFPPQKLTTLKKRGFKLTS